MVLATLVLQGFTIERLVGLLRVLTDNSLNEAVAAARTTLLDAALEAVGAPSDAKRALRHKYDSALHVARHGDDPQGATEYDRVRLSAIKAPRHHLLAMRSAGEVAEDVFRRLQEELDWAEIDAHPLTDMQLDES